MWAADQTVALGLCGVLTINARVRGVIAAAIFVEVRFEAARRERHVNGHAAGQRDVGFVAVVARVEHDDFVTRVHDGQDRRQDRLGRAGRDGDFGGRVVAWP